MTFLIRSVFSYICKDDHQIDSFIMEKNMETNIKWMNEFVVHK